MKNFRLFAATLLASAVVTLAPAQPNDDFTALRAKAEKGNGIAQYNVGLAYAEGRGIPADRIEAYVWLSLARENGARGRALDNLIASFDKASLEAAQQRLAEHKAAFPGKTTAPAPEQEVVSTVKASDVAGAGQDVPTLLQQIEILTIDKKKLGEEVAQAWKEIETVNAAVAKAEKDGRNSNAQTLDQKTRELQAVSAQLERAGKFSRELEASLNQANQQKSSLEQTLATAQTELTRTKNELAEQARKAENLAALTASQLTPSAEIASVRNELSAARAELKETAGIKSALADAQTQAAVLNTELTTARANLTRLEQDRIQAAAKPVYPDLSGKVRELEGRLTATNQQADSAVQTAVAASKQSAADLNAAALQIAELKSALAAKPTAPVTPDLSGRVRELETQLASASAETNRAQQEASALNGKLKEESTKPRSPAYPDLSGRVRELETQLASASAETSRAKQAASALNGKLKEESSKSRGPAYPNLAGRVVELQTALTDTKRDLADAQTALRAAEAARAAVPAASVAATEPSDLQKQLAETEDKLATALRGYAVLQRDHEKETEAATKAAEAVSAERNALATQVTALSAQVDQLKTGTANQTGAAQADATRASESLSALQRSTSQTAMDLAATRALLQQVQGANAVLAQENYQLKTRLAPGGAPVPANASASAGPAPAAPRTHVVAAGDTLSKISQRYYNTPARWQEIYKANAAKLGTNGVLRVGSELVVP